MFRPLLLTFAVACASVVPTSSVTAATAPYCSSNQLPVFVFGFAELSAQLGPLMGEPIECEHQNSTNGDTLQATTTGLAFYRKSTNTATFTDGTDHWALTDQGLVSWTGSSIDPPGVSAVAQALYRGDPRRLALTIDDFGPGWLVMSSERYLSDGLYFATYTRADNPRVAYDMTVKISPDLAAADAFWNLNMATRIGGYVEAPPPAMGDVSFAQWDAQGGVLR